MQQIFNFCSWQNMFLTQQYISFCLALTLLASSTYECFERTRINNKQYIFYYQAIKNKNENISNKIIILIIIIIIIIMMIN